MSIKIASVKSSGDHVFEFLKTFSPVLTKEIKLHYSQFCITNAAMLKPGERFGSVVTNHPNMMPVGRVPEENIYTFSIYVESPTGDELDVVDTSVLFIDDQLIAYNVEFQPTKH